MAFPRNKNSALMALAASAGLWAWQNRDKISAWVNDQRHQLEQRRQPSSSSYTGATTRIGEPDTVLGEPRRDS